MFNALRTQYSEEGEISFFVADGEIIRFIWWIKNVVYHSIKKFSHV